MTDFEEKQKNREVKQACFLINMPVIIFYDEIGELERKQFEGKEKEHNYPDVLSIELKNRKIRIVCNSFEELKIMEADFEKVKKQQKFKPVGDVIKFKKEGLIK
ncbi:MAG: hypothetical protein U9P90_02325 [Patescibacteria group bacterium]|nr:hypothetical protein [Patescibacteria group bacterium]